MIPTIVFCSLYLYLLLMRLPLQTTFLQDLTSLPVPYMVNSISYGSLEQDVSAGIMDSFNNEAIALAAVGSTLLVASGDDGISGHSCDCTVDSSSNTLTYAAAGGAVYSGQGYFPSFPATNPYGMYGCLV
jgi:subtilase family serine protease